MEIECVSFIQSLNVPKTYNLHQGKTEKKKIQKSKNVFSIRVFYDYYCALSIHFSKQQTENATKIKFTKHTHTHFHHFSFGWWFFHCYLFAGLCYIGFYVFVFVAPLWKKILLLFALICIAELFFLSVPCFVYTQYLVGPIEKFWFYLVFV